ncbi:hypothetical protein KIW84_061362 [Lathyrus oleraceus]|uniref:Uncharacterized protein n=1 Tax=Pisum sativum TaxID=3888 RepID=A0A9D4W5E0_PEA|nr:hypothetical protein KIW84_061362 [Pisum sativum]
MKLLSPSATATSSLPSSAFLPSHSNGFQNLGFSSATFKFSKNKGRCIRKAGSTNITAKFELKPPPYPLIACDLLLFSTEISIRDYRRNTKIINDRSAVGYLYTSCCYDIRKRRIFIQRKEQYKNDAIRKKRIFSPRYGL